MIPVIHWDVEFNAYQSPQAMDLLWVSFYESLFSQLSALTFAHVEIISESLSISEVLVLSLNFLIFALWNAI